MRPPLIDTETMIQEVVFHILGEVDTDLADYNTAMVDVKRFFFYNVDGALYCMNHQRILLH